MPGQCVVGLQWGDEAKGKIVDWMTAEVDLVIRYQGGANAGHTVVVGEQIYKLHHIPSGILNPHVVNIVAAGAVIHPETIWREIEGLVARGISVEGRLKLSQRAHLVMPWHILEDEIWNQVDSGEDKIGTTLRGIGPCYRDKVGRSLALTLGDLLQPDLARRIERIAAFKSTMLAAVSGKGSIEIDPTAIIGQLSAYRERLQPYISDTTNLLLDAAEQGKRMLFEGAQGSLLDVDHGTYPFVTSSHSSGVGVSAGSGVPGKWIQKTVGVAKAYCTRVGGGPFPTELNDEISDHIRRVGKEFGTTTGRPRRCGWFDAVAARYTCRLSGVDGVALTMLDVLSDVAEIQVCVAYELDGKRIEHFPGQAFALTRVQPVYETIPGWLTDISRIREASELPTRALDYAHRLQSLMGVPIEFISVGPDRNQTIVLNSSQRLPAYSTANNDENCHGD